MKGDGQIKGDEHNTLPPDKYKENSELRKAIYEDLPKLLTGILKGRTEYGAFSASYIGEPALDHFISEALRTYAKGTWERKENESVIDFLKRIIRSKMGHHVRDWKKNKDKILAAMETEKQRAYAEQVANDILIELEDYETLHNLRFDIIEAVVEGDKDMKKLLKVLKKAENENEVSKKMDMSIDEVRNIQARMIKRVKFCIQEAEKSGEKNVKKLLKAMKETNDYHEISEIMKISIDEVKNIESQLIEIMKLYAIRINN